MGTEGYSSDGGLFDEALFYGGGQSWPAGQNGEMFFMAPKSILSNEFEIVATNPIRLGDSDNDECYVLVTFKGRTNNEKNLDAITVAMRPEGILGLIQSARRVYSMIPLEYRS